MTLKLCGVIVSRANILSAEEIKKFENPPRFTSDEQKRYFFVTNKFRKSTKNLSWHSKAQLLVSLGYFKKTGRFFSTRIYKKDLFFVCNQLSIPKEKVVEKEI